MTIEPFCYLCGAKGNCIDGLCPDCAMNEFSNPGAAFAATFGSLMNSLPPPPEKVVGTAMWTVGISDGDAFMPTEWQDKLKQYLVDDKMDEDK